MSSITVNRYFNQYVKPLDQVLWKLPAFKLTTGNDTEYVQRPNRPNKMLTTQKAFSNNDVVVYEHPSLGLGLAPSWDGECLLSTALGIPEVKVSKPEGYLLEDMMAFFAPADVLSGQFRDHELCIFIQRFIVQDTRMRIETDDKKYRSVLRLPIYFQTPYGVLQYVIGISDMAKLIGVGGLLKTAETFGLTMNSKNIMNDYKTCMDVAYASTGESCELATKEVSTLHDAFIEYSKEDATILFDIREKALERTKDIYSVQKMEPPKKEYLTTGALVNDLDKSYFHKQIGDHKAYTLFQKKDAKGNPHPYTLEDLLQKSTVKYFAERKETAKQALALVQGGRAKNERPTVTSVRGAIADNDISGAYVSIQRALEYPIGLPRTYGEHESSNRVVTLGQFLKKHSNQLTARMYVIVVSGELNHSQNLVPSKVIETFDISEKYNPDNPKIPADFRLYSNEVINGVITSDVLEVLETCCTNNEWSSWMSLTVNAACWYAPEDRCSTPEEWYKRVADHKAKTGNCIETRMNKYGGEVPDDKRSRAWLSVPLEGFLKPYADKRKELKDARKQASGEAEQAEKDMNEELKNYLISQTRMYDAQQGGMKLVGNVNYGVMASPLLEVGNIVVSNVITGACRVAVWAHNMAMGAFQGITDGGAYDLNNVRYWTKNKPGMNTLSLWRDIDRLDRMTQKGLETAPLLGRDVLSRLSTAPLAIARDKGKDPLETSLAAQPPGQPWSISASTRGKAWSLVSNGTETFEAKEETGLEPLDDAVLAHTKHFFREPRRGNGISLLDIIKFAHKDVYVAAVFQSQTNYLFIHVSGKDKPKARGHKVKGTPYNGDTQRSNICQLLEDILKDPTSIPAYRPQTIAEVLKCNKANALLNSATDNVVKRFKLQAGDTVLKRAWVRPISLSMFCWQSDKQYQSWSKKADYLKNKSGWGLEQFFLNPDGTLNYQKAVIDIQDAIDNGQDWLKPVTKGLKVEPIATHPYLAEALKLSELPNGDEDEEDTQDLEEDS